MRMGATVPGARSAVFRRARSPILCRTTSWIAGGGLFASTTGTGGIIWRGGRTSLYFAQHRVLRGQDPVFLSSFASGTGRRDLANRCLGARRAGSSILESFSWCSGILTASISVCA